MFIQGNGKLSRVQYLNHLELPICAQVILQVLTVFSCSLKDMSSQGKEARDQRDVLRFIYQTTAKGQGKSFQDWKQSWRLCLQESCDVQANSTEGNPVWACVFVKLFWFDFFSNTLG